MFLLVWSLCGSIVHILPETTLYDLDVFYLEANIFYLKIMTPIYSVSSCSEIHNPKYSDQIGANGEERPMVSQGFVSIKKDALEKSVETFTNDDVIF